MHWAMQSILNAPRKIIVIASLHARASGVAIGAGVNDFESGRVVFALSDY